VKIVLCALKCDLREEQEKDDEDEDDAPAAATAPSTGPRMIQYNEGLEMARKIGALRYLGKFVPSCFGVVGLLGTEPWNAGC
jgi:Rho family, other